MAFTFQKNNDSKYKLYRLSEALDLDDFDDDESQVQHIKSRIRNIDHIDIFIQSKFLKNNDDPLTPLDMAIINDLNSGECNGKLKVNDTHQLIEVLKRVYKVYETNKISWQTANYNWIDTTNVTVMLNLFQNAFGAKRSEFNGDISQWNTCNVRNMIGAFEGCHSLKCDISNWDVSNVKLWDSGTYADTNQRFKEYCKILEGKIKKNGKYAIRSLRRPI